MKNKILNSGKKTSTNSIKTSTNSIKIPEYSNLPESKKIIVKTKRFESIKKFNKKTTGSHIKGIREIIRDKPLREILDLLNSKNVGLYDDVFYGDNLFEIMVKIDFEKAKQLYFQENIDISKCPSAIFNVCSSSVKSTKPLLFLIDEGVNLTLRYPTNKAFTPLALALSTGDKEKVNILLSHVVNIRDYDLNGSNILFAAISGENDHETLDKLVSLGVSYDIFSFNFAIQEKDTKVLKHILKTNPELVYEAKKEFISQEIKKYPELKKLLEGYRNWH